MTVTREATIVMLRREDAVVGNEWNYYVIAKLDDGTSIRFTGDEYEKLGLKLGQTVKVTYKRPQFEKCVEKAKKVLE